LIRYRDPKRISVQLAAVKWQNFKKEVGSVIVLYAFGVDWARVWQNVTHAAKTIGKILWVLLRYFILLETIFLAIVLWMAEGVVDWIRRNPTRLLLGMNPLGAAALVRWSASVEVWLLSQGRFWLGRYTQKFHPNLYGLPFLRIVFRPLFRKRRRGRPS